MTLHHEKTLEREKLRKAGNRDREAVSNDQTNSDVPSTSRGRRGILTESAPSPTEDSGHPPATEQQTKVLCAKLADGSYVFTSGQKTGTDVGQQLDTVSDVHLINVMPYSTEFDTIPSFKDVNRPAPTPLPSALPLPNTEIMPVQFLNFGPYLTFAPVTDSHLSTLTPNETARARELKLKRRALEYLHHSIKDASKKSALETTGKNEDVEEVNGKEDEVVGMEVDITENMDIDLPKKKPAEGLPEREALENIGFPAGSSTPKISELESTPANSLENIERGAFLAEGIDIDALLGNVICNQKAELDKSVVEQLLAENAELLAEFQQLQNARFSCHEPENLTEEERTVASALFDNLSTLVNSTVPSKLVTPKVIERAINRLPRYDAGYAGTLPPNRPHAFFYQKATAPQHFSMSDSVPNSFLPPATPTMTPSWWCNTLQWVSAIDPSSLPTSVHTYSSPNSIVNSSSSAAITFYPHHFD